MGRTGGLRASRGVGLDADRRKTEVWRPARTARQCGYRPARGAPPRRVRRRLVAPVVGANRRNGPDSTGSGRSRWVPWRRPSRPFVRSIPSTGKCRSSPAGRPSSSSQSLVPAGGGRREAACLHPGSRPTPEINPRSRRARARFARPRATPARGRCRFRPWHSSPPAATARHGAGRSRSGPGSAAPPSPSCRLRSAPGGARKPPRCPRLPPSRCPATARRGRRRR